MHLKSIAPAWSATDMLEHTERDICLGIGSPLQSFIILRFADDQAEVLTIVTDPDHRKSGHARSLLQAANKAVLAKGGDIIFLEVAEDNHPAIALYSACGYVQIGRRPAYYKRANGRIAARTYRKRLDA